MDRYTNSPIIRYSFIYNTIRNILGSYGLSLNGCYEIMSQNRPTIMRVFPIIFDCDTKQWKGLRPLFVELISSTSVYVYIPRDLGHEAMIQCIERNNPTNDPDNALYICKVNSFIAQQFISSNPIVIELPCYLRCLNMINPITDITSEISRYLNGTQFKEPPTQCLGSFMLGDNYMHKPYAPLNSSQNLQFSDMYPPVLPEFLYN